MEKLFLKIKNLIFNKFKEFNQKRSFRRISKRTYKLKKEQKSDIQRWKNNEELLENWNDRTRLLAAMVPENARVIEFGAGYLTLKNYLPPGCIYKGSDLIKRTPEVLVCDLNEEIPFTLSKYDTAVFSGVLEYVYNIEKVFGQLKVDIRTVILSYACSDISSANRLGSGWLSDYTKKELEDIFDENGYEIMDYKEWQNQSIYKLNRR